MDTELGQQDRTDMLFGDTLFLSRSLSDGAMDAYALSFPPSTQTAFSGHLEHAYGTQQPSSVHVCLGVPTSACACAEDASAAPNSFSTSEGVNDTVFAYVPPSTPSREHKHRLVPPRGHTHAPTHQACERELRCQPQPSPSRCLEPELFRHSPRAPSGPDSSLSYLQTTAIGHCTHATAASFVADGESAWETIEVLTSGAACAALTQQKQQQQESSHTHTWSAQDVDDSVVDWASIERMLELWPM